MKIKIQNMGSNWEKSGTILEQNTVKGNHIISRVRNGDYHDWMLFIYVLNLI